MNGKNIVILGGLGLVAGVGLAFYQGMKSAYDKGYKDGTNKVLEAVNRLDKAFNESMERYDRIIDQHKKES